MSGTMPVLIKIPARQGKAALVSAGVPASRLRAIDMGTGTACSEQTEMCYQRQRVVHFSPLKLK